MRRRSQVSPMGRRVPLVLFFVAVALLAGVAAGLTYSAFSSTSSNPSSSFAAKRVFPGVRTTSAWDFRDASSGTETDQSAVDAYTDARYRVTTAWSNAFAANRYVELDYFPVLPAGLAVSSPTFEFDYAKNAGTGSICFYFEVRRASTGAVLGTHGSSGTPVACNATTTIQATSTAIPEVNTTDLANDLRIRVFGQHGGSSTMRIDEAVVAGSTPYSAFTLYSHIFVDAADTTPAATLWPIAVTGDSANYQSASPWQNAFNASRYLKFTYPGYLPAGASVTSVTFTHAYRSATAGTTCHYFEVYDGTTLIGTHGSAGTPYSCNASTVTWVTDTVALPEVDTAAEANNVVVKMYVRNSAGGVNRRSQHDVANLSFDYYLD